MTDAYKLNGSRWRNRIVGYDNVAPDQLLANPANFRRHPKAQQDALAGVLGEIGWLQDVIVNRTTEHVVDGHLRVELALRKGEPTVPVKYVELTEDEERLALATFDPLSAMAQADAAALDALLASVNTGEAAVQEMLAELRLIDVIGFDGLENESREESVWNKMSSATEYRKFEFGEFRLLLPVSVHDRLWNDAQAIDNKAQWLEQVILAGIEHADDSPD